MEPKWLWVLVIVLFIGGLCETEGCLENERIALLQLKSFFNDPYNQLPNWEEVQGSNCCDWEGVKCNVTSRRVIQLSLNSTRGQYGYLNASLFVPFTELKSLYLTGNQINGFVDNEGFGKIAPALRNLEILDLSNNYLNDSILTSLSELSSLKSLYLVNNVFTGSDDTRGFAKMCFALKNLEVLDLSRNYFNDTILTSLSELSSLKFLYLAANIFGGSEQTNGIAKLSSTLKKLESLDLSGTYLSERAISSLSELSSLKSLNLAGNGFTGSNGFKWLSRLNNLETLDLGGNFLNNNFLLDVGGLSSLKTLNLKSNQLNGSANIKELNKLGKLEKLDVGINQFQSLQPFSELEALHNLKEFDFSYNELQNFVAPKENGSLAKLNLVNLNGVFRDGTVSLLQVVGAFPFVKTFFLKDNTLNKTVSTRELNLSSSVQEIFIDGSLLSDNVLQSIGALTSLKKLVLANSQLTGSLPAKGWCDLWRIEELDLSGNALEGAIPSCFHNLTSLRLLDISKNHIEIPFSLTSFTNKSHLKLLLIDQNHLVKESTSRTLIKNPKFQLKLLSMSNCSTEGLIPKELPNFLYDQYDLRYLDLSFNKFGGENPSWLLENNTRLQQFLIAGNSFNGSLQLPKHANVDLAEVDMSENKMQGQISLNICSTFPRLAHLFLSRNAFEGKIPPCLGDLKSLSSLDLSFNNCSGEILEELSKSNSLRILRLSNNKLSGKIPPSILSSSTMYQLYLDGNDFDGEIPLIDMSTVSSCGIIDINLSNNSLSGKLPRWLWNVLNLQSLDFSDNNFDGDIPLELCNLGSLKVLDLSRNNFSGSVPSCFSSLTIEHLHLSRNRLSGPLPRALYNSSSLVTLDLSHNDLIGKIPNWISTLSALRILILKANRFEGEIPSHVCQLKPLSIIDLSQNKLVGHIPSCLSNLTLEPADDKTFQTSGFSYAIKVLEDVNLGVGSGHFYPGSYVEEKVSFLTKKGIYTYSGKVLKYMSGIDLSCNRLTGEIPPEIGKLGELHSLNLSRNNLIGFIPATFSNLKQVESLDLSYNKLSGIIPVQLMELNSLAVFNVSYNNLSGAIPYEKAQFATFDRSSYLGNPFLCGPPKNESCTKTRSTPTTPNSSEEEDGFLDKHVFYATFVVSCTIVLMAIGAVLVINPDWRQAWFYFIQQCIDTCYYFILDNVLGFSIFKRSS